MIDHINKVFTCDPFGPGPHIDKIIYLKFFFFERIIYLKL